MSGADFDPNSWIERFRAAGGTVTSTDNGGVTVMHPSPLTQKSADIMGELWQVPDGLRLVEAASFAAA